MPRRVEVLLNRSGRGTLSGMTHAQQSPEPLTAVVARNLRRLRGLRDWSQADLAKRLRAQGLLNWSPSTVAKVETGFGRADYIFELAALCACFEVPLTEFLKGEELEPIETRSAPIPLTIVRLALEGIPVQIDSASLTDPATSWDEDRLARLLGITTKQFSALVFDVFKNFNFAVVRDRKAGLQPAHKHTDDEGSTRVRRGHATRALLPLLRTRLEADGIDAIWERTRASWDEYRYSIYLGELEVFKRNWKTVSGQEPTERDIEIGFGKYLPDKPS